MVSAGEAEAMVAAAGAETMVSGAKAAMPAAETWMPETLLPQAVLLGTEAVAGRCFRSDCSWGIK